MRVVKNIVDSLPFVKKFYCSLNNQYIRDDFVIAQLETIQAGKTILDAGCGSQRYRPYCEHLNYKAQDFGQYITDEKKMIGTDGVGGISGYQYGTLDYIGNVWEINESDSKFDAILCTEVLEHIPYPNETINEFSRLLKKGGKLILTAPSNCLRHMDPYFFYSGFSDRWYESILKSCGLEIQSIAPVGDYYSWIAVEIARTSKTHSTLAKLALLPAFIYYYLKTKTSSSIDTLCMGYHVVAIKS